MKVLVALVDLILLAYVVCGLMVLYTYNNTYFYDRMCTCALSPTGTEL